MSLATSNRFFWQQLFVNYGPAVLVVLATSLWFYFQSRKKEPQGLRLTPEQYEETERKRYELIRKKQAEMEAHAHEWKEQEAKLKAQLAEQDKARRLQHLEQKAKSYGMAHIMHSVPLGTSEGAIPIATTSGDRGAAYQRARHEFVSRAEAAVKAGAAQRQAQDQAMAQETSEKQRADKLAYLDKKAKSYGMAHVTRAQKLGTADELVAQQQAAEQSGEAAVSLTNGATSDEPAPSSDNQLVDVTPASATSAADHEKQRHEEFERKRRERVLQMQAQLEESTRPT